MNIVRFQTPKQFPRRSETPCSNIAWLLLAGFLFWGVTGCDSSLDPDPSLDPGPSIDPGLSLDPSLDPGPAPDPGPTMETSPGEDTGDATFTLEVGSEPISIVEGAGPVDVPVSIVRRSDTNQSISLSTLTTDDANKLSGVFTDAELAADQSQTILQVQLAIGPRPILPQIRTLTIVAEDSVGLPLTTELTLQITPTPRPDVYLLIGQSNMVGISEPGAKQAQAGGADEPDARIRQLNVTGNDQINFSRAADFTDPAKLVNSSLPLTSAIDPLHDGLESDGGKSGNRIGLGLSFAKSALNDTTATIYLVPAAWSDTGFCKRDTNPLAGIGWNATAKSQDELAGTLLYDRAVARTNLALEQTDGILRGILWHQGEADSEVQVCAQSYAANLKELAEALRSEINVDARGMSARGANADIPFIAGTMATGGTQLPFSEIKSLVDTAHRTIGSSVAYAEFANADDLVPPAFACGGGGCIHFGADAYRELGRRYYDRLLAVLQSNL